MHRFCIMQMLFLLKLITWHWHWYVDAYDLLWILFRVELLWWQNWPHCFKVRYTDFWGWAYVTCSAFADLLCWFIAYNCNGDAYY